MPVIVIALTIAAGIVISGLIFIAFLWAICANGSGSDGHLRE